MIINFGKALRNSFTTKVFSKFLTYKSTPSNIEDFDMDSNNNLVSNLKFLVEIQDYKVRKFVEECILWVILIKNDFSGNVSKKARRRPRHSLQDEAYNRMFHRKSNTAQDANRHIEWSGQKNNRAERLYFSIFVSRSQCKITLQKESFKRSFIYK